MLSRSRPMVSLAIKPSTPLSKAWLPKRQKVREDGVTQVTLDPLEWSFMMASIGELYLLEHVCIELTELAAQQSGSESSQSVSPEQPTLPQPETVPGKDILALP